MAIFPDDDPGGAILGGKAAALRRFRDAAPRWAAEVPAFFVLPPSDSALSDLDAALARLGPGPYAVRSSGAAEDGGADSFAGQFETLLNVSAEGVAAAVHEVRRSAGSDSVIAYCRHRALPPPSAPAVIVQRMVAAEAAGVAFSADPVSGARDMAVVAAVRGLGDRLVNGSDSGETWRIGPDFCEAPADAVLTEAQARAVVALARGLADEAGRPQDVEWALADGRLYLLQSRPITTLPPDPSGRLIVWDNSNIVESYNGITTPLTFSFAHRAYGAVYTQLARLLGVPASVVVRRQEVLRDMIGLVHGRVYYNLLNWYHALALLPGFAVTRGHMETMMGVDRALSAELTAAVEAARPKGGGLVSEALRITGIVAAVLYRRTRLTGDVRRFHAHLDRVLTEPALRPEGRPLDRLAAVYRGLEERLLGDWNTPLVNDLFCMVSFGALKHLLARWCGDHDGRLCNGLLVGQGGIVSAEPARRVREMAALAAARHGLAERLVTAPAAEALAALRGHVPLSAAFDAYLERFGDRCIGELKLESPTLADEPLGLVRAIGQAALAPTRPAGSEPDAAAALEARLKALPLWRRTVIGVIGREARERVRDRENLRFERTRVFGRVRRVFLEMGRRLAEDGRIDAPRDVFHLTVEDLLGLAEGSAATVALRELVALRRQQFDGWRQAPPPPRRFATRGAPAFSPLLPIGEAAPEEAGELRSGLGCCPGVVRGRVRVVRDPAADAFRPGDILVAEATDPGWVTLIAAAAGMVVERGSLLSHSAIVAREMGVPTVVGLAGAVSWLRTGDIIELDGSAGTVRRLPPAEEDS